MAEAHAQGKILVLAVACFLGFSGPVAGQDPIQVDQRAIPPSPKGELSESDIARAVAMIRDLGTIFAVLGEYERAAEARDRWTIFQRTYHNAANRLDTMLAGGQITFRDLPETQSVAATSKGIVLDSTLAGHWQPDVVRASRRTGAGDWADISRLAGVLVAQQALANAIGARAGAWEGDWVEWFAAHERTSNLRDLVGEVPDQSVQPLLVRFWHIQDKYLANALASRDRNTAGDARFGRAASLSNEMLTVLKQIESIGGWRWRKPLETVWRERDTEARAIAARALAVPEVVSEAVPAPKTPTEAAPPRSADFDKLFADPEPAPLVIAAGPVEDISARADIDALYRENSARNQNSQKLAARLGDLSGQVEALAANVTEQGRQLEALTGEIAVTRTIPKALEALTTSQSALERRLADLSREVGPDGLSGQLAVLKATMDSAQSQSRDAVQSLEARVEARVEERLRTLGQEVAAAQRQASELQSKLSAFRPSAAAVEVPLQEPTARQNAFRQAVVAGIALLVLLLAAIAFWLRGARQRADDVEPADQNALRDELTQLRADIDSERIRAGDLDGRLTRMTAQLSDSQARAKRLTADLTAVRADTRTVSQGLLDGAARDEAMGDQLAGLRQAVETERARARDLQTLVDKLNALAAQAMTTPQNDDEPGRDDADMPKPAVHQTSPPAIMDLADRRRAIEALLRGDLPGFEQAFARLTALPLSSVERIVRHSGGQDLALACRAVGITKPHLAAILILGRRAQPGTQPGTGHLAPERIAPRQLAEAITVFDESSAEAASQALQDWRAAGQ